jgi:regulator of sirC expression with transglutaminase-like and TPR domain
VVDRVLLLAPGLAGERRDRGRLHARLGRPRDAVRDLEAYLSGQPPPADAAAVRRELRALRQALGSLN